MNRITKFFGGLLVAATLAACGGGGGSPGTTTGGGSAGTGGTGGTAPPGSTVTSSGAIQLDITNTSATSVSNIDSSGGFVARATVSNASGAPETNRLVTFSLTDSALATLSPATALTNASGVAQVSISPSSLNAAGAATLSASAVVGTATLSVKRDFGVSSSNLALSAISVGSASLPAGGNTSIAVTVLVNGAAASATPVNVTFAASCGRINSQSGSVSVSTNGSGVASATYTAVNADGTLCSGPTTVTAAASGATGQSATVTVAAATANALSFVSAVPEQIFIAGSGALEQSTVKFRVQSGTAPLANQTVTFSLTVNPGGVGLNSTGSTTPVSSTTDASGIVSVSIFSGSIPGPVRVRATLAADPAVFAESQNLTVASGPPSQRYMSLSAVSLNIEGWARDGVSTSLTVRLADRQGNPVADGTVINFTAEAGQVASSCTTAKVGGISLCSVDFVSQNPRPSGGRASILAYTAGTKDYVDVNGNNRFDAGDTLVEIGDAYRDDNDNGIFDSGEFLIPRGGATACAGSGAPFPGRANTCDGQLATTVRQQIQIVFSSSKAALLNLAIGPTAIAFDLASNDNPGVPMPVGTTLSVVIRDKTLANNATCALSSITPSTVPNTTAPTSHRINLDNCAAGDQVQVLVTAPSGLVTPFDLTLP